MEHDHMTDIELALLLELEGRKGLREGFEVFTVGAKTDDDGNVVVNRGYCEYPLHGEVFTRAGDAEEESLTIVVVSREVGSWSVEKEHFGPKGLYENGGKKYHIVRSDAEGFETDSSEFLIIPIEEAA